LHVALSNNFSVDLLVSFLEAHPSAAREKDSSGNYPLICGLKSEASSDAILCVLNAYTKAASENDQNGDYHLHLVIRNNFSLDVILSMVNNFPDAALKDSSGKSPVHLPAETEKTTNLVHRILELCPGAAKMKDAASFAHRHRKGVFSS
jgi:ankyrin repeat protein